MQSVSSATFLGVPSYQVYIVLQTERGEDRKGLQ